MKKIIIGLLLLAVVTLIYCQDDKQVVDLTLKGVLDKLEDITNKLKDMEMKLGILDSNYQELSRKTKQCLPVDDFDHVLTNESAAGTHHEIKSLVQAELLSRIISLSETDECSEGSHNCGSISICENTLFSFTCSCPHGFSWDGSDCADIDECVQGKADCSSRASCKNTVGSYSCSCNPPFEGDGRTCSCPSGFTLNGDICEEFKCRRKGKFVTGLGCIKIYTKYRTFQETSDFCQEKGGQLIQNFDDQHTTDIKDSSYNFGGWVGIYDEKWMSNESPVPKSLWATGYQSNPLRRCGFLEFDYSTYSPKVTQRDCSEKSWGYCQFPLDSE